MQGSLRGNRRLLSQHPPESDKRDRKAFGLASVLRLDPNLTAVLYACVILGAVIAIMNLTWPLARNALPYAKAASDVLTRHFDLYAVAQEREWTGGKPLFFSVVASPLVWLFGVRAGIVMGSTLGSAVFLYAVATALPRLNFHAGVDNRWLPLEFAVCILNPLVLYQFWSGYPDSLFAGFILWAFVLTDSMARHPDADLRWQITGLCAVISGALFAKLFGAVLSLSCPLYLFAYDRKFLLRVFRRPANLAFIVGSMVVVILLVVTAKIGVNPLLVLDNEAGFNDYFAGLARLDFSDIRQGLGAFSATLLLTFNILLLFLFARNAWSGWGGPSTLYIGVYVLGLLPFPGTADNVRYFLPVLPFLAPMIAAGAQSVVIRIRAPLILAYCLISALLVLNFNIGWMQHKMQPLMTRMTAAHPEIAPWLDSLRLPLQMELKRQIDTVNARVPVGSVLYWSSSYYAAATHGLAHEFGVKKGIEVRYVLNSNDPPATQEPVYLIDFTSNEPANRLWLAPRWANVISLGHGVYRLDPVSVRLTSQQGDYLSASAPMRLSAEVDAAAALHVVDGVAIFDGENPIQTKSEQSNEFTVDSPAEGRHEFVARVKYGQEGVATSAPVVVYVGVHAFERTASLPEDITMKGIEGSVLDPIGWLTLAHGSPTVYIRFAHLDIPPRARVSEAHLDLAPAKAANGPTILTVRVERADSRDRLNSSGTPAEPPAVKSSVKWILGRWNSPGKAISSPDIGPLLEELVSRPDWQPGEPVAVLIDVEGGERALQTFDEAGGSYPRLQVILRW